MIHSFLLPNKGTTHYMIKSSNSNIDAATFEARAHFLFPKFVGMVPWSSWEEYSSARRSMHMLTRWGNRHICTCKDGLKKGMCKHAIGSCVLLGQCTLDSAVTSVPITDRRQKGRPKRALPGQALCRE